MSNLARYNKWHRRFAVFYIISCMGIILAHPILKFRDIDNNYLEKVIYEPFNLELKSMILA